MEERRVDDETLSKKLEEIKLSCVGHQASTMALERRTEDLERDVSKIKEMIFGNGRDGMKSDLVALKARINLLVAIGTALVVAIVVKTVVEVLS